MKNVITTGENCPLTVGRVQIIPVTPVPKPRMTQRDRWKVRPPVARYRAFCDQVRLHDTKVPACGAHIIFVMPMPQSWSSKKKALHLGKAHLQTPDADNLMKALLDAVYDEDSGVWDVRATKVWGYEGKIIIKQTDEPVFQID